jgi:ApaG protein
MAKKPDAIQNYPGLRVRIDDVLHMPELDAPPDKPYPFVYFISIHNDSAVPVTLYGRKWVVKEGSSIAVFEGDGIVGQTPRIEPGRHFSYNSYHVVAETADVSGAFFGIAAGARIYTLIPSFRLVVSSSM